MIEINSFNAGRVITIINYEKYQGKGAIQNNVIYYNFQKSKVREALPLSIEKLNFH